MQELNFPIPRTQALRTGGGEPGLYCERKWLLNNPQGQDLTLYDAFKLTFINTYVILLDLQATTYINTLV